MHLNICTGITQSDFDLIIPEQDPQALEFSPSLLACFRNATVSLGIS